MVEKDRNKLSIHKVLIKYYIDMNAYHYFLLCLVGLCQQQ